jgi:hypothetical protein
LIHPAPTQVINTVMPIPTIQIAAAQVAQERPARSTLLALSTSTSAIAIPCARGMRG